MQNVTLVTGNKGKLTEWQRLLPSTFKLRSTDIDLEEIQSLDLDAIIADKARRAYEKISKPVIVEDIAASLDKLNGLPGPFIKFFEVRLGADALFQLATAVGDRAVVDCTVAYFDGNKLITVRSRVRGSVVPARGNNGFGFDKCFVPEGQNKTYGQMTPEEKDAVSHRSLAVKKLAIKLAKLS